MKLQLFFYLLLTLSILGGSTAVESEEAVISKDFETGSISPWVDQSSPGLAWTIQSSDNDIPKSPNGDKYLAVTLNEGVRSGRAVLRSPAFTASSDDFIRFDLWIEQGSSLKVLI